MLSQNQIITIAIIALLIITGGIFPIIKAVAQATGDVIDAEKQIQEELTNAINQAIEESCESLDETSCDLLKSNMDMFESVSDVVGFAKKLKVAQKTLP